MATLTSHVVLSYRYPLNLRIDRVEWLRPDRLWKVYMGLGFAVIDPETGTIIGRYCLPS
jgi:hypothetical protein